MDKNKNNKKKKSLIMSSISLIVLVIILAGTAIYLINNKDEKDDKTISYTDLIKEISYGNIEKVEMTVGSTSIKVKIKDVEEEKRAIIPNTEAFVELIHQRAAEGNDIELKQNPRSVWTQIPATILSLFPTFIMLALFIMIFKMQGLGEKGQVYEETERKTKIK